MGTGQGAERGSGEILVTGGSGFIGRRLVRRLVRDGHTVRALARSDAAAATVAGLGAVPARADLSDLSDPDSVRAAASGCELVFHAAALTTRSGRRADFRAANVTGTVVLLDACRAAGVRRVVHVGTEAALLVGQALVNADETVPLRPDSPAHYPATKAEAELAVRAANGPDLETVVVRPRFVWGAGDSTLLPELVAAVRAGRFAWINGGRHLHSVTHVDNVVEGLVLGAQRGSPGEAYFVTDGEPVEFRAFATELLATQGIEPPGRSIPGWVARAVTASGEGIWRLFRLPGAPPLDYMSLWATSLECTIDISKARKQLGYVPVRSPAHGMAELRASAPAQ